MIYGILNNMVNGVESSLQKVQSWFGSKDTPEKRNNRSNWSYVKQIGKGVMIFTVGAFAYLTLFKGTDNKYGNKVSRSGKSTVDTFNLRSRSEESNLLSDIHPFSFEHVNNFESLPHFSSRSLLGLDKEVEKKEVSAVEQWQQHTRRSIFTGIPGYKWTNEFKINSYTNNNQGYWGLAVTNLFDNKFVVVWNSDGQDGSGYGVYGRIFNATGYSLTSEFKINSYTNNNQGYWGLAVTNLVDNKFVVVWNSDGQDGSGYGVYGRIFNATGHSLTSEFQVNSYTNNYQGYRELAVSNLLNNKFVVVWNSDGQDGSYYGVYGRVFNTTGDSLTSEFQVNSYTIDDQGKYGLAVTNLFDNKFVVLWTDDDGQDGSGAGVYGRIFNIKGYSLTSEFQINSYTNNNQGYWGLAVTNLLDNKFAVVWNSDGQDGSGYGIYGRIFNATGDSLTSEFQVNSYTNSHQGDYRLAVSNLSGNNFVVVWNSDGQDGSGYGVYGRIFNATGHSLTSEFQVNSYTNSHQGDYGLAVSNLPDNNFVVVWNSDGQDGSSYGVFGRVFLSKKCPQLITNQLVITRGGTIFISNEALYATDADTDNGQLVFTVRNTAYGRFEKASQLGVAIFTFRQQEITDGTIRFVHDNSNYSPSYEISVSDDYCKTDWNSANITFNIVGFNNSPYGYIWLGIGGAVILCSKTAILTITVASIYVSEKRKQLKAKKLEIELAKTKTNFELGDFLISCKIDYQDFEVLEQIGVGGEAAVYKAKWADKDVAYKIFNVVDQSAISGFQKEAEIMLQSNHPNVIRLYGVCVKQGTFGLLLEFMEMGSLKEVLKKKIVLLTWYDKWNIAHDIASAIKFLHSKDVVHRDIKTDNVLLYKESGEIHGKIADFGLSKTQKGTDQSITMAIGTYKYMAPEMTLGIEGCEIGHFPVKSVDIYAFGMTCVAMCLKTEPYPSLRNEMYIPAKVGKGELWQEISEEKCPFMFFNLTNRCRAIKSDERPTAEKIVEELESMKRQVINFGMQ